MMNKTHYEPMYPNENLLVDETLVTYKHGKAWGIGSEKIVR